AGRRLLAKRSDAGGTDTAPNARPLRSAARRLLDDDWRPRGVLRAGGTAGIVDVPGGRTGDGSRVLAPDVSGDDRAHPSPGPAGDGSRHGTAARRPNRRLARVVRGRAPRRAAECRDADARSRPVHASLSTGAREIENALAAVPRWDGCLRAR